MSFLPFLSEEGLQLSLNNKTVETTELCTDINIASLQSDAVNIGTSSIFLEYNPEALSFNSYESKAFDKADHCEDYPFSIYSDHNYYAAHKGAVNITISTRSQTMKCAPICEEPITVGTVCFQVLDDKKPNNIRFNESYTSFNKSGGQETFEKVVFPTNEGITSR